MRRRSKARIETLKIDGQHIGARDDETILQLAKENGIKIPTLCHLEGLPNIGACRLCLVEIRGQSKLQPACQVYAREGMEVFTNTERLQSYRRMVLGLLFAERNHVCSVCVSNGHCDLQDLAIEIGMTHVEVPYLYPILPIDASHNRFVIDHNRCVLCRRCVRVCGEIEGAHTWDVMGRGHKSRVITDLNQPWGDSESCTSCGKCVQVCPTGALFEKGKAVAEMTKRREFLPYLQSLRED
ncbi:MAG: bidirectional hydrogenase complex protein HoxU [Anaerolineae bacterium]|nr:bidirectional hydrogenase complex protein HoxU [Anaerolineae bacterium]MCO5195083.1 bidirectional hydrogenase complex protein HoxU [Anaerolineae bacterium]MCO5197271.1 bidirectional hydrogenase complex protein HoxU [Anaerolineae bacterium]MCO5204791.1 bidirectional hydrogenase complex protein HoxU [Anaerolineae bacterium]